MESTATVDRSRSNAWPARALLAHGETRSVQRAGGGGRVVETTMVLEVLSAELTVSPNHTAGWNELVPEHAPAMRFPWFTGRRR